ncbi:MAG: Crp/Fnr family transcriptional regulator [Aquificaceae bacterium]
MEIKQDLLSKLRPMGKEERFSTGEVIFAEGDKPDKIIVIASGHVSIYKKSHSGEDIFVGLGGPGSILGEMSVFLGGERTATVRASSNVVAIVFEPDQFLDTISKMPELAYTMLREFSKRVYNLNRRIINVTTSKLMFVVGMYLLDNLQMSSPEEGRVELYVDRFSTEYSMDGSKVGSVLNTLQKAGVIRVEGAHTFSAGEKQDTVYVVYLNPERFRAYLRSIAHV